MADDEIAIVDNLLAPEFFADDAMAFSTSEGTLRIVFSSSKWTQPPPGKMVRVVTGRLVMPISAAQRLVVGLNDFLTKTGNDPSVSMRAPDAKPN